jgi:DNA primase
MALETSELQDLKRCIRLSEIISRRVKLSSGKKDRFGLCPFHADKKPSFSVNDAKGFYHCFGCGAHGDILDWLQNAEGLTFSEAVERLRCEAGTSQKSAGRQIHLSQSEKMATNQDIARSIWRDSVPIHGTPAEHYLRGCRGISIELPNCLRFHPALRFDDRAAGELPALVASVVDLAGSLVAIQRTFLLPDGSGKARIERPKRALGPVGLGAVCLAPSARIVGVAEGIETGLSAMELFAVPVWCALGSNLARVALASFARNVAIFADLGEVGERAAASASVAFHSQNRLVTVRYPKEGKDFNDELKGHYHGSKGPSAIA